VARDGIKAFVFVLGSGIAGCRGVRECSSVEWLVLEEHLKCLGMYNDCKLRIRGCVERNAFQQCRGVAIIVNEGSMASVVACVEEGKQHE
jgi:hypothetical protein